MIKQKMAPLVTNYSYMLKDRCLRCGRKLKSKESMLIGYGPSCYKKHIKEEKGAKLRRLL